MENASKALIIAGAILISILLISIGIIIMNSISGTVDQAGSSADQYTIQQFNANFTKYEGIQKGSSLRDLTSTVTVVRAQNDNRQLDLVLPVATSALLGATTEYEVTLGYDNDGYINSITVSE